MAAKVFVPHDELVWATAVVITPATEKGDIEIRIVDSDLPNESGTKTISLSKYSLNELPLQNTDIPTGGIADMCNLPHLHEASILDNLRRLVHCNYCKINNLIFELLLILGVIFQAIRIRIHPTFVLLLIPTNG